MIALSLRKLEQAALVCKRNYLLHYLSLRKYSPLSLLMKKCFIGDVWKGTWAGITVAIKKLQLFHASKEVCSFRTFYLFLFLFLSLSLLSSLVLFSVVCSLLSF